MLDWDGDSASGKLLDGPELISGYGRDMELEADGLGAGFSSVAVAGGRIFTLGDRVAPNLADGQYVFALSEDGGESWTPLGQRTGLPNVAILDLELDPESPVDGRRLWATALGEGLFVSTDSGRIHCFRSGTKGTWIFSKARLMSPWVTAMRLSGRSIPSNSRV